ncbi:MAG TPA: hypothetical protein PKD17_02370 [Cellvibrionaceae bacterium]|nr:hypothetical protein [Cellvibrionaceae bacterium]
MNQDLFHKLSDQDSVLFSENSVLQQAKIINTVSRQAQTDFQDASQPLKGFLMDKGGTLIERQLARLENAVHVLQVKMVTVKDKHLAVNREYKCSYLRMVLTKDDRQFAESRRKRMADRMESANTGIDVENVNDALKRNYQLSWRANPSLSQRLGDQIKEGSRVFPFSPTHPHHAMVMEVLRHDAPRYMEASAAFESVRVSLNAAMRVYKLLAQELALQELEYQFNQIPEINKYTQRQSENIIHSIDPNGQLQKMLGTLFCLD